MSKEIRLSNLDKHQNGSPKTDKQASMNPYVSATSSLKEYLGLDVAQLMIDGGIDHTVTNRLVGIAFP